MIMIARTIFEAAFGRIVQLVQIDIIGSGSGACARIVGPTKTLSTCGLYPKEALKVPFSTKKRFGTVVQASLQASIRCWSVVPGC